MSSWMKMLKLNSFLITSNFITNIELKFVFAINYKSKTTISIKVTMKSIQSNNAFKDNLE